MKHPITQINRDGSSFVREMTLHERAYEVATDKLGLNSHKYNSDDYVYFVNLFYENLFIRSI